MNAPRQPPSPYPGIRPFREDEAFLFFGREAQVDAMVDTLARGRFLAVIGSSGCGKSSLVNCGLRPALHRGLLSRAGSAWRMASCRPGGRPLKALAEALAAPQALPQAPSTGAFSAAELIEATLALSRLGLVEAWRQAGLPAGTQLLVVVDQFEELFRYRALGDDEAADSDEDPATAFVNLLLEARRHDLPIHIVITMRSDFLGDCAHFPGLPEAINSGLYLVPRMSRDERRAAILGPVRVFGADIAPTLLTRLVNDVGDDPDQLSLLQHALARTWAHWQASGAAGPLGDRHYDAVGTLAHALNQHAEEIYAGLSPSRQALCAASFRALTDSSTDSRGIRRPTRQAELLAITGAQADELDATLHPFRAPGAAFLMPPAEAPLVADSIIDLAHESLMRIWERLRDWGQLEMESARMLHRLADAAELHARGEAGLWRDPELQFALDWQTRSRPTPAWARQYGSPLGLALAFLEASRADRDAAVAMAQARAEAERRDVAERRRQRRVWRLTLLAILASTLVTGALGVLWQRAERAGEVALSRQLAAQSASELASGKVDRSLRLASAGYTHAPTFEARDSLLAALAEAPRGWHRAGQQGVLALAASPDGKLLASAGRDGSIRLWDAAGRQLLGTLAGHRGQVLALSFAPNGSHLASAGADHRVMLWDLATRRPAATLTEHQGPVLALAFSPDGRTLASAGADRRIVLREGDSGLPRGAALLAHSDTVTGLAFSPDGQYLASTGYDGNVFLWAPQHTDRPRAVSNHPAVLHDVAFSPDGKLIATASADRHVLLWEAGKLAPVGEPLSGHGAAIRKLAFSPDARFLVSVGDDSEVRVHDLSQPESSGLRRAGHRGNVQAVLFGSDGFFTAGTDDLLIHHHLGRHGPLTAALPQAGGSTWAMAFSPDGRYLACADRDARIALRNAVTGASVTPPRAGHTALVGSLAFSPDGEFLASAGQDGRLLLWPNGGQGTARVLQDGGEALRRVVFSPDGHLLAAAGRDGQIRLWSLPDGLPRHRASPSGHGSPVSDLAFTPDGQTLASAGYDGSVHLWAIADGRPLAAAAPTGEAGAVYRLAWSADGRSLALATQKQGLLLWSLAEHRLARLGQERIALLELAWSPDRQTLVSADRDGAVQLWDISARLPLHAPLLHHAGPVLALAWAPDGRHIATAGWNQGILLSRSLPEDWTALACTLADISLPAGERDELPGCPEQPGKTPP